MDNHLYRIDENEKDPLHEEIEQWMETDPQAACIFMYRCWIAAQGFEHHG